MLASLGIGTNRFVGPQIAPPGDRTSFLSVGAAPVPIGSSNLSALLEFRKSRSLGNLAFDLRHISAGRFTEETIKNMHKAVLSAKTDALWRETMENIRQEGRSQGAIGWKDYMGEVRWFDRFYRGPHFIDYVRDPGQVELVMHPWYTFTKRLGDCDDSCLDASMRLYARIDGKLWFGTVAELFEVVAPTMAEIEPGATLLARFAHEVEVLAPDRDDRKTARFAWRRVVALKRLKHEGNLKRVETVGGRAIVVTPQHRLFKLGGHRGTLKAVRADDLSRKDQIITCADCQFDVPPDPRFDDDTLFFYGFWIGDGCYEIGHGPKLSCGNDEATKAKITAWAEINGIHVTPRKGRHGDILLNSRALEQEMRALGFVGDSHTKRVPRFVFLLSNSQIAAFLKGYFAANDSASVSTHRPLGLSISASSVSRLLLSDIQLLLTRLGVDAPVSTRLCKASGFQTKPYWTSKLEVVSETAQNRFVSMIGSIRTVAVKEAPGRARSVYALASHKVRSVSDCEPSSEFVYDLQVEGLQAFVVEGIVSHNSTLWAASLGALGAPHRFRTYRADPSRPDEWSHVAAQIYVPGQGWVNNDLTIRGAWPGYEPVGYPFKDWPEPRW